MPAAGEEEEESNDPSLATPMITMNAASASAAAADAVPRDVDDVAGVVVCGRDGGVEAGECP